MHTVNFIPNQTIQTAFHDIGDGVPFLLVHGFTGSKLDFHDQLRWFADAHRVIAYDQRGHGESSNLGPYNLYTLASDLVNLLDALHIDQCHVLGHSLGGMVVMRAMLATPGRFRSAIFMDTAPYAPGLLPAKVRDQLNKLVLAEGCEALFKGMQGQTLNKATQRGIDYLGEAEHWRRIRVKLAQMDPEAFVELGKVLGDHPSVLSSLRQITQPVTVIAGEQDTPFVKPAREMASTLPNAKLVLIPDSGHSPQYENAEFWRASVENHLAEV
jgi:2-succinyl-6-hydroxy-2,4-cyclohexadiene-1-carboxylate synthase